MLYNFIFYNFKFEYTTKNEQKMNKKNLQFIESVYQIDIQNFDYRPVQTLVAGKYL